MAERPSAGDYIQVLKTTVPNMVDQIGELAMIALRSLLSCDGALIVRSAGVLA